MGFMYFIPCKYPIALSLLIEKNNFTKIYFVGSLVKNQVHISVGQFWAFNSVPGIYMSMNCVLLKTILYPCANLCLLTGMINSITFSIITD